MNNRNFEVSNKQKELINLYTLMAQNGYQTHDDQHISVAFSDMEIRAFKDPVKKCFFDLNIKTVLDYGCGGSNYETSGFSEGQSAKEFFNLTEVHLFEPARDIDQRTKADAVVCFDVLEHIFISDLPRIIHELFTLTEKLLIVNVACYSARAMLPNGENAHITVRDPMWWKGIFDCIASEYPDVAVQLYCSTGWRKVKAFQLYKAYQWQQQNGFVVPL
jgi:hypothetical protein